MIRGQVDNSWPLIFAREVYNCETEYSTVNHSCVWGGMHNNVVTLLPN